MCFLLTFNFRVVPNDSKLDKLSTMLLFVSFVFFLPHTSKLLRDDPFTFVEGVGKTTLSQKMFFSQQAGSKWCF